VGNCDGDVLRNVLLAKLNKKRPLGRPRTKWKDAVEKYMSLVGGNATLD
jgi:hypothetical protein